MKDGKNWFTNAEIQPGTTVICVLIYSVCFIKKYVTLDFKRHIHEV